MAQIIKKGPSWMVRVSIMGDDGKQHKKSKAGFKTKAAAKAYAAKDVAFIFTVSDTAMWHTCSVKALICMLSASGWGTLTSLPHRECTHI